MENKKDYFNKLGKYICEIYNGKFTGKMTIFNEYVKKVKSFKLFSSNEYSSISIMFLTGFIDEDVFKKLIDMAKKYVK